MSDGSLKPIFNDKSENLSGQMMESSGTIIPCTPCSQVTFFSSQLIGPGGPDK